jgi:hypothetical protein
MRRSGRFAAGLVAAMLLLSLAACSITSLPGTDVSTAPSTPAVNDLVTRALRDIERYWSQAYPTISGGSSFAPISGGYHPYTPPSHHRRAAVSPPSTSPTRSTARPVISSPGMRRR